MGVLLLDLPLFYPEDPVDGLGLRRREDSSAMPTTAMPRTAGEALRSLLAVREELGPTFSRTTAPGI